MRPSGYLAGFNDTFNCKDLTISGKAQALPTSVSQSSTYVYTETGDIKKAENAIDGDLKTFAHTKCAWDTDVWYKMKFDAVYCFSDVVIINSKLNEYANRMDEAKVLVINTETGAESLCGVLKVTDVMTIEGQTYRIPCDLKCGDEVKVTLRHDKDKYRHEACIHMNEISAFHKGFYFDLLIV